MRNAAKIAWGTDIEFVTIDLRRTTAQIPLGTYIGHMRNAAEIGLGTNIGFVTPDLRTQYRRNRSGNEHGVCNQ